MFLLPEIPISNIARLRIVRGTLGLCTCVQLISLKAQYDAGNINIFLQKQEKQTFIDTGIYGISRNPQNLGVILLFITAPMLIDPRYTIVSSLACMGYMKFMSKVRHPKEEAECIRLFGIDYINYSTRVNRWFGCKNWPILDVMYDRSKVNQVHTMQEFGLQWIDKEIKEREKLLQFEPDEHLIVPERL